jgi:hypothetical protein
VNEAGRIPGHGSPHAPIELDLGRSEAPPRTGAPSASARWGPEPPESSWLQDNLRLVVLAGTLAVVSAGAYLWWNRPVVIPDLAWRDGAGQTVTLSALRQDKPKLLVVFLLRGCPLSRYSLDELKGLYGAKSRDLAFVGLLMGSQSDAEQFQKETETPFPVFGLNSVQDPYAVQELFKKVGVSTMATAAVYGGTVVVVDRGNKVLLRLEKEECRELKAKLARL